MALSDAHDMFTDVAKEIGDDFDAFAASLTQKLAVEAELDVFAAGDPAKLAIQQSIASDRAAFRAMQQRWQGKMDSVLVYWGTQLTTPSSHIRAGRPSSRPLLLRDIRADMVSEDDDVASLELTWDSEPTPSDNMILDLLTEDEHGITIEGGIPCTVDAKVHSVPAEYRSIVRLEARVKGTDVFNRLGPVGFVDLEAVNGAGGDNLVRNPTLNNANTSVNGEAVTSLLDWNLSTPAGSVTHVIDTSIAFRGQAFSHKLYGSSGTRRFDQPLILLSRDRRNPRNYKLAVYKTGTPTGDITLTHGGKNQAFSIGSLSAGWNYLRLDRDKDLWPDNFYSAGMRLRVDVAFTGGDAGNYINLAYIGGQNYRRFNGGWYGHWSRNGFATPGAVETLAHSADNSGLNQRALALAYHGTDAQDEAYLRHIGDTTETIADYA